MRLLILERNGKTTSTFVIYGIGTTSLHLRREILVLKPNLTCSTTWISKNFESRIFFHFNLSRAFALRPGLGCSFGLALISYQTPSESPSQILARI
jgi:hypothetical protein